MKIGITCYPTYGGSGVVATELGKKMATMGHEIHFIAYQLPYRLNNFSTKVFFHEVDVLHYPLFEYPPYSLSLASKMVEVIEFANLDILHVHYAIPHATSAFLAREMASRKDFKFVTTLHGTDITLIGSDPSYLKIVKFSIENSNGITAVSEYLKKETQKIFKVNNDIRVIHNFIPDNFLSLDKSNFKKRFIKDKDEFIISHISNFRPLKRVTDLVYVMEKLVKKFKVKLYMVGDGPERYRMEQLCREKKLCDNIIFLGKQDNVEEVLAASDVFVLPSAEESFGLAVLEALACGVPCVTTNAGGLPEVNINETTGFTVGIGDVDSFAEKITLLLEDASLRKKMGKDAQDLSQTNFNSDKIVPNYLEYYQEIIEQ